jgi:hypothetical protein
MAMSREPEETRARRSLALAASGSVLGIALSGTAGTVTRITGGVLLVTGWLAFVYALHSFGRAGSSRD